MPHSKRYLELIEHINKLKEHLLPEYRENADYSEKDIYFIHSFRLLAHAELESYFEDIIREAANDVYNKWLSNRQMITQIIFNLLNNYRILKQECVKNASELIELSYKKLIKDIDSNNGIKSTNIVPLINYVGFSIDDSLLMNLNSYGSKRGIIAHNTFTKQINDPKIEGEEIEHIIEGITVFDESFLEYKENSLTKYLFVSYVQPSHNATIVI